jgi:hypothetical protein
MWYVYMHQREYVAVTSDLTTHGVADRDVFKRKMTANRQEVRTIADSIQAWFGSRSFAWTAAAVALVYLVMAVFLTWPLVTQLNTHTPAGFGGDVWAHHWTYWWVKTAVSQGQNPFITDLLYYPEGVSLTTHNIPWFNIGLWIPLQAIIGGPAAFGLIYILAFAFNGFAMFLLVREHTERTAAAFIGGLIFGAWPFVVSQTGHPNTIILGFVPLTLLMLKRTMERGRARDALVAGLFLALTGIVRWQLLIIASIAIGLFIINKLVTDKACRSRKTVMLLLLVGLVSLVLMAPLLAPVITGMVGQEDLGSILKTRLERSSDLLSYVIPNHRLRLYGGLARQLPDSLNFSGDTIEFMGFVTLILLGIGVVKGRRAAWPWLVILLVYLILALGPVLTIAHQPMSGVPMPFRLVQDFFLVRIVRYPMRYNIFLGLPVAMLSGIGMAHLLNHTRLVRRPVLFTSLLAVVICAESWMMPYRTLPLHTPEWYDQLAQESGEFALLDLPMDHWGSDKNFMYYQISHDRPILGGHVSRLPAEAEDFIKSDPFLSRLAVDNTMDPSVPMMHQLGKLSDAGIRYLILHRRKASGEQLDQWQEWLAIDPLHEDEELIVYGTDPAPDGALPAGSAVTESMQFHWARYGPEQIAPTDPIYISSRWGSTRDMGLDYDLCFQLVDSAGRTAQEQCQRLGGEWPTSKWTVGEVALGNMIIRIDPFMAAGDYRIRAALVDSNPSNVVGEPIDIGPLTVRGKSRVYELPDDVQSADAFWEEKIGLPGYRLHGTRDQLEMTLYWQALSRMDASYKFFTHLVNESNGAVVAQNDAVPRQWSYPTNWWEQNEVVEDTIVLPVDDVAPGNYLLYVGWYDPETGDRLDATTASGEPYLDNSVLLTTWQR